MKCSKCGEKLLIVPDNETVWLVCPVATVVNIKGASHTIHAVMGKDISKLHHALEIVLRATP
jgi:hypothetical protein